MVLTPEIRYPYQDHALDPEQRVDDLLSRMPLEDKAGLMFQPMGPLTSGLDDPGFYGSPSAREMIARRINHVNILKVDSIRQIAEWHNALQTEAAALPLAIPFTISSDPRHAFSDNPATAHAAGPFSQWPEFLGFGAIDDPDLTRRFAELIRREYVAVGIRTALHPQIDCATDPRWARTSGTFGQSAEVATRNAMAYVRGLQGTAIGPHSVSAMAKHFPGGGPQKDGEDPHFDYGREQVYPGERFKYHLRPFRELIAAGVSQIMPSYGVPVGTEFEEVGFGFNKQIITGLLRKELSFDGIVCADWMILSQVFWGTEGLSFEDRMVKALEAGLDQFGGEHRSDVLVGLVRAGRITESRLDLSARRLLLEKFQLGLFENRYVNIEEAQQIVGTQDHRAEGLAAQAAAYVLLTNDTGSARLPLRHHPKVYVENLNESAVTERAEVVASPEEADIAIVRLEAPWEPRGTPGGLESLFRAGSLEFSEDVLDHLREIAETTPLIVDVYLDRPAILAPIVDIASTVTANFGASSEACVRILFGLAEPRGRLPFEIPSSMAAVESSRPDVPSDTAEPTFTYGYGLRFEDPPPAIPAEAQAQWPGRPTNAHR